MFIKNFNDESFPADSIEIKTVGRIGFSTNRLNWVEIKEVEEIISRQYQNYKLPQNRRVSLFYDANSNFKSPEALERMKDVYNALANMGNIDFSVYGSVAITVDFEKFTGKTTEELRDLDYGIIIISDSSSVANKTKAYVKYGYAKGLEVQLGGVFRNIEPISSLTKINIESTFDQRAFIIIYAVDGYVEKREGEFWPSIRIVQIPVVLRQNPNDPAEMFSQVKAKNTRFNYNVTKDIVGYVLRPVVGLLRMFNYKDAFAFDLVRALGENPDDYIVEIRGDHRQHVIEESSVSVPEPKKKVLKKKSKSKSIYLADHQTIDETVEANEEKTNEYPIFI